MNKIIFGFGAFALYTPTNGSIVFNNCFTLLTWKVYQSKVNAVNGHLIYSTKKFRPVIKTQLFLLDYNDLTNFNTLIAMINYQKYGLHLTVTPFYSTANSFNYYYDCLIDNKLIIFKYITDTPAIGLTILLLLSGIQLLSQIPISIYNWSLITFIDGSNDTYVDGSGNSYTTIG